MTSKNLERLAKICPEKELARFVRLKKWSDMVRSSNLPAYENYDDDTTVPFSFKEIDAIARRFLKTADELAKLQMEYSNTKGADMKLTDEEVREVLRKIDSSGDLSYLFDTALDSQASIGFSTMSAFSMAMSDVITALHLLAETETARNRYKTAFSRIDAMKLDPNPKETHSACILVFTTIKQIVTEALVDKL